MDYASVGELRYTLQGVDLVISTISGDEQLNLIDAARRARVRTFVPSEFEGSIAHRPTSNDPLDRGSEAALDLLRRWSQSRSNHMQYTVFSCGVFYERFGPGGLGFYNIGAGTHVKNPGDFLADVGNATAEIVEDDAQGRPIQISMTSVFDVARFVAAAIEIGPANWPRELRMRGDQLSVRDIVGTCSNVRGGRPSSLVPVAYDLEKVLIIITVPFDLIVHQHRDLQAHVEYNLDQGDWNRWYYFQRLIAAANGRYTFDQANLNEAVNQAEHVDVTPETFRDWLQRMWPSAMVPNDGTTFT